MPPRSWPTRCAGRAGKANGFHGEAHDKFLKIRKLAPASPRSSGGGWGMVLPARRAFRPPVDSRGAGTYQLDRHSHQEQHDVAGWPATQPPLLKEERHESAAFA